MISGEHDKVGQGQAGAETHREGWQEPGEGVRRATSEHADICVIP